MRTTLALDDGNLAHRKIVLTALSDLLCAVVATDAKALQFIDHHALFGRGVGYVDTHRLAAVRLTAGAALWTRGKRLNTIAVKLGLARHLFSVVCNKAAVQGQIARIRTHPSTTSLTPKTRPHNLPIGR